MLKDVLEKALTGKADSIEQDCDVLCVVFPASQLVTGMTMLRDGEGLQFDTLIDVCGVDYQSYGRDNWHTTAATSTGFSRGQQLETESVVKWDKPRFATAYHLLSTALNQRVRVMVYLHEGEAVPSVVDVWPAANWFEREAYDLFGIEFEGHPDLRRLLTDYGFVGHPFRKDFPLIGEVEMRYDAKTARCVYEPVSIQPRVNVPKVIRYKSSNNTYEAAPFEKGSAEGMGE